MKNKILFTVCFLFFLNLLSAQKYDYNWIIGYVKNVYDGSILNRKNIIHFNDKTIDYISGLSSIKSKMSAYNLTASDSMGNLIFYFNGLKIYNADNKVMTGGDSIGYFLKPISWDYDNSHDFPLLVDDSGGSIRNYTQKFIPFPGHSDQYLMFCTHYTDSLYEAQTILSRIIYARIDMTLSGGKGAVVEKNKLLIHGHMTGIGLVKHANGRDWWLVTSPIGSNIFYVYLISPVGITGPEKQIVGPKSGHERNIKSGGAISYHSNYDQFSPDGKTYVKILESSLMLYDFNRCTGELSFRKEVSDFPKSFHNIAFSPDSRFIYSVYSGNLYQLDLKDSTNRSMLIAPLVQHVYLQLAPDERIYFSYDKTKYMGYINRPNQKGLACDVRNFVINTPVEKSIILPQFPNYRLRAEENINCPEQDSIFLPFGEPHLYKVQGKEYTGSDRYKMIDDTSWKDLFKVDN